MLKKQYRTYLLFIYILLFAACSSREDLAPVSELMWNPKTHTVQRGETLYAIAFRYDTDYRKLALINHIAPPYSLRVGEVLNLQGSNFRAPQRASYAHRYSAPAPRYKAPEKTIYSPAQNIPSSSGWIWPVHGQVRTTFLPAQGKKGINIACVKGEKVRASSAGVVAYAGNGLAGYGNLIIIKHNNQYLTAYGNNARNLVSEGQRIQSGQAIAEAGVIDRKYWGVHFEIRKVGIPVNPLNYLQKG